MLAFQIDDKEIEESLYSRFKTVENIKQYFHDLLIEDLENKKLVNILDESHKKDFVSKDDVFQTIDIIRFLHRKDIYRLFP